MKLVRLLALQLLLATLFVSCEKDTQIIQEYADLEMMDDWQEFEISDNQEIIFKVTITSETRLDLSWKDMASMKEGDTYTGDILVSAYRPDGLTPYFEDADAGYQLDSKMIEIIEGDVQVLIIVKPNSGQTGTFAIRLRGLNDDIVVTDPKPFGFGTSWAVKNCNVGDIKWLEVDCLSSTEITVEWGEFDRQVTEINETLEADVKISVFSENLDVIYVDAKNHGFGENARKFSLTHNSSIIYILVSLNDDSKPGSYALRVYPQI